MEKRFHLRILREKNTIQAKTMKTKLTKKNQTNIQAAESPQSIDANAFFPLELFAEQFHVEKKVDFFRLLLKNSVPSKFKAETILRLIFLNFFLNSR